MEVIKSLKNILCGRNNIFINISLFSLVGILTTALCYIISTFIPTNYFGYPPKENYELSVSFFIFFIISIFLFGYIYDYANTKLNKETCMLIDIKINSFVIFAKMLPLFFIFVAYFAFGALLGLFLFRIGTIDMIIYYGLLTCFIPFIFIIYTLYAKEFKLTKDLLNPINIIKIIKNTFTNVISFAIKTLPLYVIICFLIMKIVSLCGNYLTPNVQLGMRILGFTVIIYLTFLYNLLFIDILTTIIKNKKDLI